MTAGPALPFPDRRLPDLVAEHARAAPTAVAIQQGDQSVSYAELAATAAALAATLAQGGGGPEVLVGVCADRTPSLIAALLGVLQAGCAYVPLDPSLPAARLHDIAREAGLAAVVCDPAGEQRMAGAGAPAVPIPPWTDTAGPPAACPAGGSGAAYVMFTSGSTGRPKGVVIPHEALTEFVTSLAAMAGLDRDSRVLAFASLGFDASVIEILAPLAAGATVALIGAADRADPVRLQRFCRSHRVSAAFIPPAVLPLLDPAELPDLTTVMTGSEAPGPEQVGRWTAGGRRFLNLFGPTEATVLVTWFEATGDWDRPLPIGAPAANHRVHVVDATLTEVDPGPPGELLVGGPGLARGYLGDPALTARRFVPDPDTAGGRLYRTGDLVSWSADGTLQFIGRTDRQIKVRGQRVEIGEIEAVLRRHPEVDHAVVAALARPSGVELVAFTTGRAPAGAVRAHCERHLPAPMVPARVLAVPQLPLVSSGKVDLDRLLAEAGLVATRPATTDAGAATPSGVPAGTPAEEQVAAAWAAVLGEAPAGRDDDFFERGGHSITAMRLVTEIRARAQRDLAIEDVLDGRTVRAIAARAEAAAPLDERAPVRGRPPALSPAQRRLWFLDRYSPAAAAAYNVAFAERLRGPLDVAALRAALAAVAERQQALRWRIPDSDGVPWAVLDPPGPVALLEADLTGLGAAAREAELVTRLGTAVRRRFDLAAERLWQPLLFRLDAQEHVLAVIAHHAVFDGWSQSLLYADLAAAYRAARGGGSAGLPALPATYADYVAFREERQVLRADADMQWWLSHLDGVPAVLEVPPDRPRPPEQSFGGGYTGGWLDAPATAALHRFARARGATPSAVLLAAFALVLGHYTGRTDLVVGSPMVDRRHADFEAMVGFFIDIAPLRLRPDPAASFARHVHQARDELLAALAHPEAPLDRIVAGLGLGGDTVRTPLVQVLFNMFNFAAPALELPGLASEPVPVAFPGSPFDLTLYGIQRGERLRLEVVFNADLYHEATMAALLSAVRDVVAAGVAAPDSPVDPAVLTSSLGPAAANPPPVALARRRARTGRTEVLVHPATPTEQTVAGVWCDVLGRAAVGVTDSFFDVGGGSLAMVAVQQRLNRITGRSLRVVDLFRYPTVRALAGYLDEDDRPGGGGDAEALARAAHRGRARRDRGRMPDRRGDGGELTREVERHG